MAHVTSENLWLGIDVGGSSAKIGVVSQVGDLKEHAVIPHSADGSAEELVTSWLDWADQLVGLNHISEIAAALPGHITKGGTVLEQSNVTRLDGFPLKHWLEDRSRLPTTLLNDATAAGIGEIHALKRPVERFMIVTLGTGVGVAVFVDGAPLETINETLGDIGHIILSSDSALECQQGCKGCLEAVASAQYLARVGRTVFAERSADQIARSVIEGFRSGDEACGRIFRDMSIYIGMALASWTHQFRPDIISIGGGLSHAGPRFLTIIRDAFETSVMKNIVPPPILQLARAGNLAGVVGAAHYAMQSASHGVSQ